MPLMRSYALSFKPGFASWVDDPDPPDGMTDVEIEAAVYYKAVVSAFNAAGDLVLPRC
jgi:hypothetical protein